MIRHILAVLAFLMLSMSQAMAIDANNATQAELETIKGIGPAISARIIEERKKNGAFKSLDDLEERVKGVGENTIRKMAESGLTVGGSSRMSRKESAVKAEAPKASAAKDDKAVKEDKAKAETKVNQDEKPKATAEKEVKAKADAKAEKEAKAKAKADAKAEKAAKAQAEKEAKAKAKADAKAEKAKAKADTKAADDKK